MQEAVDARIKRAISGDLTTADTLAKPGGGLGGARVRSLSVKFDNLEKVLGKYMTKKVRRAWSDKERGPGVAANGDLIVSGLELGNIWISVQPLLGVEGDPMRLLFERDLTPHPQYIASYKYMSLPEEKGGIGAQVVIHLGMHGTVEWLPGQPLGNDRQSWSDELLGSLPNIYCYAANNPSESILAKRRGYGTLVSYNVPPYGRAGLYLELANLKDLVNEYRDSPSDCQDIRNAIWTSCQRCGIDSDVPLYVTENSVEMMLQKSEIPATLGDDEFDRWVSDLSEYLIELQDRLFSSGLHTLGNDPSDDELLSYLHAYFGDSLGEHECLRAIESVRDPTKETFNLETFWNRILKFLGLTLPEATDDNRQFHKAQNIVSLLKRNKEEMDSILTALDGGFILPAPGGDLLRDGTAVLPTGRNIHALDPYR